MFYFPELTNSAPFRTSKTRIWEKDLWFSGELADGKNLIQDFLANWRKIGLPIDILDLTGWNTLSEAPVDIKKLEFSGLKVVWKESTDMGRSRREYVCGSGRLEELGLE